MSQGASPEASIALDPLSILLHASGPVLFVNWLLVAAAVAVWIVAVLKLRQIGRLRAAELRFEAEADRARGPEALLAVALRHPDAPGSRAALALLGRASNSPSPRDELAEAEMRRALLLEEQRATSLFGVLSTIGSAGPFVGLFGTVWGILDAFLRIGREKSASLPVVAPAIGEALISTAVGLFAAIPAVVLFNVVSRRADDLFAGIEAASETWAAVARAGAPPPGLSSPRGRPPPDGVDLGRAPVGRDLGEPRWAPSR